ncbi:hypothetical protein B0H13DRAFT_2006045 [Mycena leptocephala]|nr:hypothetical protein B0H13DRAFT_2006045 [Mycena leptocephala]
MKYASFLPIAFALVFVPHTLANTSISPPKSLRSSSSETSFSVTGTISNSMLSAPQISPSLPPSTPGNPNSLSSSLPTPTPSSVSGSSSATAPSSSAPTSTSNTPSAAHPTAVSGDRLAMGLGVGILAAVLI